MVQGKNSTASTLTAIQRLLAQGNSYRTVQKKLAELGIKVSLWLIGTVASPNGGTRSKPRGRPPKLTERDLRHIHICVGKRETKSLAAVHKRLYAGKVSRWTVARALKKDTEIKRIRPRKDTGMKPAHKRARVQWAKTLSEGELFWLTVTFVDETHFTCDDSSAPQHELWLARGLRPTVRRRIAGGGSVRAIIALGPGGLFLLETYNGELSGDRYAKFLDQKIVPHSVRLMHDNHGRHHTPGVQQVLRDANVEVVPQPALSPDLQPVENIISVVKRKLYANNQVYDSTQALEAALEQVRADMLASDEHIQLHTNLAKSMPRRMRAVLRAKGASIRY